MFARVVTGITQPGRMDEATRIYKEKVLPAARAQKGFHKATLLSEPRTGKCVSITLWDTEGNMIAGETSGYFSEALAAVAPTLAAPFTIERFEVAAQS